MFSNLYTEAPENTKALRGVIGVRIPEDSYFLPNSANKPKDDEIPLVQIRNQKPSEKEVGVRNISELIESLHLPDISSYFKWQTCEQVYLQGKKE